MEEIVDILKSGIPLYGTREKGISKNNALSVIQKCLELGIAILGGDVGKNIDGFFEHNYDNWSCDKFPNELPHHYVKRSVEKAKEYISNYSPDDSFLFILVLDSNLIDEHLDLVL